MQSFKLLLSLGSFPFPFLLTFTLEDGPLPLSAFLLALSPNDTDTLCECDSFLGFLLDLIRYWFVAEFTTAFVIS